MQGSMQNQRTERTCAEQALARKLRPEVKGKGADNVVGAVMDAP